MKFHAALLPQLLHLQKSPGLAGKQRAFPGIPQHQNRPTHRGGASPLAGPERTAPQALVGQPVIYILADIS